MVRNSATRRYLSLLFLESLDYFYLNVGLFHSREEAQKGEIFRDPEPIASFFPSPTTTKGNVSERNQHRPSKDTRIRPVQSRTSPMILTNNYQRIIKIGREGPTTTPTQTKGQRSSLGLPVTSTPFSDLNAGYGPSLRTVQDENGTEETSDKRSGIRQLRGAGQRPVSAR